MKVILNLSQILSAMDTSCRSPQELDCKILLDKVYILFDLSLFRSLLDKSNSELIL